MLKLNDVTWLYQHLPMRFTLDVARGERIAVLGPSGIMIMKSRMWLNWIPARVSRKNRSVRGGSSLVMGRSQRARPPRIRAPACPVTL